MDSVQKSAKFLKFFKTALLLFPIYLLGQDAALTSHLSSLDPLSVAEHLAFYEVYSETEEGKEALAKAWRLLSGDSTEVSKEILSLPSVDIRPLISLITESEQRKLSRQTSKLKQEPLQAVEKLSEKLANRNLKGHQVWTRSELLKLEPHEIDLGRGVLIEQFQENLEEIRQYEASLDLMALQIRARLPKNYKPKDQIREINNFIFQEMRFRFPPHSIYAKNIDLYTFLPSVMDSREGVCLGVSILYICLAQRLGLPLEIITPPGHIYVRYRNGTAITNIETTARGTNLPSDTYLGIDTRFLQERTLKEVIGLVYVNEASVSWSLGNYETAIALYQKAVPYLKPDPLLDLFIGLNSLFVGNIKEGQATLKKLSGLTFDWAVSPETIPDDYLNGKANIPGIQAIFMPVDETRASILAKQAVLAKNLKRYPKFRAGLLQLAVTWLQLGRNTEARSVLEQYHTIDPKNCIVEYYLTVIAIEQLDYNKAWHHLKLTESILKSRSHRSPSLRGLRYFLRQHVTDS